MNWSYRPGMRVLKSVTSVFLSLLFTWLLHRPTPFFAAITAVVCMQQDYQKTFVSGLSRGLGTCIGGAVGFLSLEILIQLPHYGDGLYVVLAPLAVLASIWICNLLEQPGSITISCIVLLNVMLNYDRGIDGSWWYVMNRVIDTNFGILSAYLVDRWMNFPDHPPMPQVRIEEKVA